MEAMPTARTFQFLMVRLKAKSRRLLIKKNRISIPYGAIKRYISVNGTYTVKTFQFLMVRLKVNSQLSTALEVFYFNSLWCD